MSSRSRLLVLALMLPLGVPARADMSAEPVVAVWYRGVPAGEPRQDDLAVIRALGFRGVAWPAAQATGLATLTRLATAVDLTVVARGGPVRLSPETALRPAETVDVLLDRTPAGHIPALAWRAVAHGARVICFDAGHRTGAGVSDAAGAAPAWLKPAQALSRQIASNSALIRTARPGPAPIVDRQAPDPDVVLLDGGRAWLVIATNTSDRRAEAIVRLPRIVPYAIWVSLIDGSDLAMRSQPAGPEWRLDLEPGGARVYVIDKTIKRPDTP
jgi:hypothetical protein